MIQDSAKWKKKRIFLSFSNDHTWHEIRHFTHFKSFYVIQFLLSDCTQNFPFIIFITLEKEEKHFQDQIFVFVLLGKFFYICFLCNWSSTSKERWCVLIRWMYHSCYLQSSIVRVILTFGWLSVKILWIYMGLSGDQLEILFLHIIQMVTHRSHNKNMFKFLFVQRTTQNSTPIFYLTKCRKSCVFYL